MAAVSSFSTGRALASHRTHEGAGDEWDFEAPVDQDGNPTFTNSYPSKPPTSYPKHDSNLLLSKQNGSLPPPTSSARLDEIELSNAEGRATPKSSRSAQNTDPSYLSPFRNGLRPDLSRSGSEPDSLLDLYGHPRSSRSIASRRGDSMDNGEREAAMPETYTQEEEDPERSRWIHRDKLAVIESREMQDAGISVPLPKQRPGSRSKARRDQIGDIETDAIHDDEWETPSNKHSKKRRVRSPVRQAVQEPPDEVEESTLVNDFDIRTPEEIAADSSPMYRQHIDLRKSSSRIPLPRSSPMPIPQEHLERNTPLPRKRGASGTWNGDDDTLQYTKPRMHSRSNSYASQNLLNDPELQNTPTSPPRPSSQDENSPSKPRSASTPTTKQGFPARKSSLSRPPTSHQKNRSNSTTPRTPSNPSARPKSRSGIEPRPPTAINRPEGDPPWLATMYKPDPRLPPDQQILPTHAKRLQQEQWDQARKESEARQQQRAREDVKDLPPRDFSPLAVHTRNGLVAPSSPEKDKVRESGAAEWPLTKATSKSPPVGKRSPPVPDPATATVNGNGNGNEISNGARNNSNSNARYSPIPPRPKTQQLEPGHSVTVEGGVQQEKSEHSHGRDGRDGRALDPFEKERLARVEKGVREDEEDGEGEGKRGRGACGACCVVM